MKDEQAKSKKNRIWMLGIAFLAVALILMLCLFRVLFENEMQGNKSGEKAITEAQKVHTFQVLPDIVLAEETGDNIHPLKQDEDVCVFLFWASYCPYCQESVDKIDMLARTAERMGAKFFLVNKLDGEKETKEQAMQILEEKQVETKTLFDKDCTVYNEIGLTMIPTLLITDQRGQILVLSEGNSPSGEELELMIEEVRNGKSFTLSSKIMDMLMGEDGGIKTNYKTETEDLPSGEDILSESQGILLEYAALTENQAMFDRILSYTQSHMFQEGLMPWVISAKTETKVNALIDDLRIIGAIQKAEKTDKEQNTFYQQYLDAVYTYNTDNGNPLDFYDVETEQKADRFTLCYGDFDTLGKMKEADSRYEEVYKNALELVRNGKISEKFPLYYSYYDYTKQKYEGTRLNMAEAMTTLLHLAEVGELPDDAMEWIAAELEKGFVYAAYDISGSPSQDGYYESTSVYALIVMTALLEGREDIAAEAINRMEQFRVKDAESEFYGMFGNSDGTGIYSFDQGMALLAYESYERMTK